MSSVLDYMFDNDWIQRADIENLKNSASQMRYTENRIRRKVVDDAARIQELEDQVAHLTLINEAILRILEKKAVFARDEFRALLVEVDLEDGVHDGKLAPPQRDPAPKPKPDGTCFCKFCGSTNDRSNQFCSHCRRPLVRVST
jgi:hypothetical protein